ncbi:CHY zinc finger protein [Microbacterium soli]|uniref:CHY zinc finger protein n=1 Tax=Microbacterium soli TaxID=446075 RepID=A0ABP7NJK3_9MICO
MSIQVGGWTVRGAVVDAHTRCVHYGSELDVVAMRSRCCGDWYPCVHCHDEAVSHSRMVWEPEAVQEHAVLCGACGTTMSISQYRDAEECPLCGAGFNPGCRLHHDLYFAGETLLQGDELY